MNDPVYNELIALTRAGKIDVLRQTCLGIPRAFGTKDRRIIISYSMLHWIETFEVFVDKVSVLRTHDEDKAFERFLSEYEKIEASITT